MIISDPNEFVGEVHDRMPVLLMLDQFDYWLAASWVLMTSSRCRMNTCSAGLVSKRVNSSKAEKDDATLIEPIREAA